MNGDDDPCDDIITRIGPISGDDDVVETKTFPDLQIEDYDTIIGSIPLNKLESLVDFEDLQLNNEEKLCTLPPLDEKTKSNEDQATIRKEIQQYENEEKEPTSIIKLFRSHWMQKWENEYKERAVEYRDYEKRMIHLRKHLSVLRNMVAKSRKIPCVDLKQDLHGIKILTDDRNSEVINIENLKKKEINPGTFIPEVPNKMVTGGVALPDDMKEIISMQVKPIDCVYHEPIEYKHPKSMIKNYSTPQIPLTPSLPHIPGHVNSHTDEWQPGAIFKVPGVNRYYDDWNQLCQRKGYRKVENKYEDYEIKGQLRQFMQYNTQKHSKNPNRNDCLTQTKRWPVILSSWHPSEPKKNYLTNPNTSRTARSMKSAQARPKKVKKSQRENPEVQYRRTPGGSILHFLQRCQTDHVFSQPCKKWTAKHQKNAYSVI